MYALVLALSGLIVAVTFGVFIPWCTRLLALYWAHFIRDRIYAVGDASPQFRETLIYCDAEWVACLTIRALRERDGKLLSTLARVMSKPQPRSDDRDDWRATRYKLEINDAFVGSVGFEALSELVDSFLELAHPVALARLGSQPSAVLVSLALVPIYAGKMILDRATPAQKSDRVIARAERASRTLGTSDSGLPVAA